MKKKKYSIIYVSSFSVFESKNNSSKNDSSFKVLIDLQESKKSESSVFWFESPLSKKSIFIYLLFKKDLKLEEDKEFLWTDIIFY